MRACGQADLPSHRCIAVMLIKAVFSSADLSGAGMYGMKPVNDDEIAISRTLLDRQATRRPVTPTPRIVGHDMTYPASYLWYANKNSLRTFL